MKKIILTFIFMFLFIQGVDAECSYKERKELLNKVKSIDIGYDIETNIIKEEGTDPDTGEDEVYEREEYSFKFYVTNLDDSLYIRYYNLFNDGENYIRSSDLNDNIYNFVDNDYMNLYTYYFEFRSNNDNCVGDVISTKKIIKPIFNAYSIFSICKYEGMENYKGCNKFITKRNNLNESQFIDGANKYYDSLSAKNDNKDDKKNDFKKYYIYGGICIILIIIIIVVVIRIRKKRSEL